MRINQLSQILNAIDTADIATLSVIADALTERQRQIKLQTARHLVQTRTIVGVAPQASPSRPSFGSTVRFSVDGQSLTGRVFDAREKSAVGVSVAGVPYRRPITELETVATEL